METHTVTGSENKTAAPRGAVYRCPVCGAELSVVRRTAGVQAHLCCNTEMVLTSRVNPTYFCSVCGTELMLIKGKGKRFSPVCCNEPMGIAVAGRV
jgi:competence CoiA-like predicted nuclease